MRVLFPFVGDTVGGSHHSAALAIREFPKYGVDPCVIVHKDGPLLKFLAEREIRVESYGAWPIWEVGRGRVRGLLRLLMLTPKLWLALRRFNIDLVHANDGRIAISWCLACRMAGIPLVVHQRTRLAESRISRFALRLAARVITVSKFTQDSIPASLRDRSVIVNNPFDRELRLRREETRGELLAELNLENRGPLLVFVGTLQVQKRPRLALEALAILRESGLDARLIMVGRSDTSEAKMVRERIRELNLVDSVRCVGFRRDAQRFIAAADVLLAPAVDEGYGRCLVEAMLLGTPVVAAASGGHIEIIEQKHTGILFPPEDLSAFSAAITSVITNTKLHDQLVGRAREKMLALHNIDNHLWKLCEIYRDSIGRVAFVIESMEGGGAQHVASNLLESWDRRGDRPLLITFKPSSSDVVYVPSTVDRKSLGGAGKTKHIGIAIIENLRRVFRLRQEFRRGRVRTVVSFVTATNVLVILAAIGMRVRVVVSERNDPVRQTIARPWRILRRVTYPFAWRVTANSKAALKDMSRYIPAPKLMVVRNSLRQDVGSPSVSSDAPFILSVGRLHPQKNYPMLIESFAKAFLTKWRLKILGSGEELDHLRALAEAHGVSDQIDWLGHVSDPYPYYRAAKAFVMTSIHEGSPNALWEAMSVGVPSIITSGIVGAFEIAEDGVNVVVVPDDDPSVLTRVLKSLPSNVELWRSLSATYADSIRGYFSPEVVLSIWDNVVYTSDIRGISEGSDVDNREKKPKLLNMIQ